ncbi:muconolactone Delta-isomerase [Cryobacterium sp. TMS1-13-1]|uniref:muconolactone Delta-isomerase n=1 Tax=Cryobacterium sp. TMS1-13-1 TaxID=1259220 RepID=UPI00106D9999|nr:muconolactone Delta-isomerase family protein [Cryobacterium sp. TMS1-13-1]TFD23370.1 muconolactone delta-isomerase [Cryobacterium sp. TMS1-13-1]
MLYAVTMTVSIPPGQDPAVTADTLAREKSYSQDLQRTGEWAHIWRTVGHYSNLSIFDVASNERLHEILWGLPLFPFMEVDVAPLCVHPSSINRAG